MRPVTATVPLSFAPPTPFKKKTKKNRGLMRPVTATVPLSFAPPTPFKKKQKKTEDL